MYKGFVNKFYNGTMAIWQRGPGPFTVATTGAYTADGWIVVPTGASCTATQTTSNGRTGRLSTYSLLVTGASGVTDVLVKQRIESYIAQQIAGQTVTIQAQVYNNTGSAITPKLTVNHANAVDNWSASTTDVNAVAMQSCANGAWTLIAYTFASSASSGNGLEIIIDFGNSFSTTGKTIQITELDIRSVNAEVAAGLTGRNTSPPPIEVRDIQSELAFCQRYFETSYDLGTTPGTATFVGSYSLVSVAGGATQAYVTIAFKVTKRSDPTITYYSPGTGASGNWYDQSTSSDTSAVNAYNIGMGAFLGSVNSSIVNVYSCHYTASAEL